MKFILQNTFVVKAIDTRRYMPSGGSTTVSRTRDLPAAALFPGHRESNLQYMLGGRQAVWLSIYAFFFNLHTINNPIKTMSPQKANK